MTRNDLTCHSNLCDVHATGSKSKNGAVVFFLLLRIIFGVVFWGQVILGILLFPSFLLLEYRTREELELMPQTKEEHIQDQHGSSADDSDSSSSSSGSNDSMSSSRHSVKSERHGRHSVSATVPPSVPSIQEHPKVPECFF